MIRSAIVSVAAVAAVLACAPTIVAQSAAPATAQVTAADAAPFLGAWTLEMQGQNGPATMTLTVKVDKEKVVGEITTAASTNQPITDVTKAEKSLVLRYNFDYQGQAIDAVVRLTPAVDGKVSAQIDFAGGAYVMTGTATKKDK